MGTLGAWLLGLGPVLALVADRGRPGMGQAGRVPGPRRTFASPRPIPSRLTKHSGEAALLC